MSKKGNGDKVAQMLPEDVQNLIKSKLRHLQREQGQLWTSAKLAAYSKLRQEISANVSARRIGRAFTSIPIEAYKVITAYAVSVTKEWPGIAWENIKPILDSAPSLPNEPHAINAIIDEFTWPISQEPFTLNYIDPDRFKGVVHRESRRYGGIEKDFIPSFNEQLSRTAVSARVGIVNEARNTREGIRIAIGEYLLKQRKNELHPPTNIIPSINADARYTPTTARRETRKLDTQAMYKSWGKEYRKLMKNRPNMTGVWYSRQIAKLDIAQGRNAETIRKNMKN